VTECRGERGGLQFRSALRRIVSDSPHQSTASVGLLPVVSEEAP